MPPQSPLPQRHGLGAAWVRTPDRGSETEVWGSMGAWLRHRLPDRVDVDGLLEEGRFVNEAGRAICDGDPYRPHYFIWFHRDLRIEEVVPGEIPILYRDERLVVIDKPAFLASIPRGRHITQSAVVRLRSELELPELSPAHRLDRVTSGVLVMATERRFRGAYQSLFQQRKVTKVYRALAPTLPGADFPIVVRNHIRKDQGNWQATVVPDAPVNAETIIEAESTVQRGSEVLTVYRLSPVTGRTHQLRVHLSGLGIPITDDPLYPAVLDVPVDDFSTPLQLLASELIFDDPVDGNPRRFVSQRQLPLQPEPGAVAIE